MDSKSWMNLLKTQFVVGEKKLITSGIDITHEAVDVYYSAHMALKQPTRMVARVQLMRHYSPERVTIEGDAELVHAILEKLK